MQSAHEFTYTQLLPLVKADILAGNTPMLLGKPGIGKSSFTEALEKTMKTKVFTMPINQMADRADITGARIMKDEDTGRYKQAFFPHAIIDDAIEYAENNPKELVILFLDEINRASADITSTVLAFITTRMCGTMHFPDNIRFVTAGNDKGNVVSLDDASLTRFIIYHVKPDIQTFLAVQDNLNPYLVDVLNAHPEDLMGQEITEGDEDADPDPQGDAIEDFLTDMEVGFRQMTVPRTITYLSNFLNEMGFDKSGSKEEMQMLQSLIAETTMEDGAQTNLLTSMLISHIGYTTLTMNLSNCIVEHYNNTLNAGGTGKASKQSPVEKYRPKQEFINKLHHASSASEVEEITNKLTDKEKNAAFLWMTSLDSRVEVDNNKAFDAALNLLADESDWDLPQMSDFIQILVNEEKFDKVMAATMISHTGDLCNKAKGLITSMRPEMIN